MSWLLVSWLVTAAGNGPVRADWNDDGIAWRAFEAGLAEARREQRPVCLIFFTTWCPHCHNYSRVFADPKVVDMAKRFVMVRLDKDQHRELSSRFAPDGEYVPRTYFLRPDGSLMAKITAPRKNYRYFYDERDPASVLGGMRRALAAMASR